VEAKEGVKIESENLTLATITIQNYFRMYEKLAGMTGTADTEAVEFKNIYKLDVVVIPPNKPMRRTDYPDVVYKSEREKFNAVVEDIQACHARGQPVLVGTTSVEKSERVSKLLKKAGVKHNVLNAINHEAEANIIAQAGRFGQVTIATNMAGRGTDILLGGNPEFLARAEMENEWIRGAIGGAEGAGEQQRYEDALRALRERYEEEVARLRERHARTLETLEEQRAEALKRLTEAERRLRELSPLRALRERYEQASSVHLIAAVRERDAIPERRAEFAALRERYDTALAAWEEQRTDEVARALDDRRAEYERGAGLLELALLVDGPGAVDGELGEWRAAYRAAEAAYAEAERRYEEARQPYEEGLRAAERRYEEARRGYVEKVEQIREELQ